MTKYANLSIEYLPMSFFRCLIAFSFSNSSFIITCSHMPHVKQNYHVNWGNTTINFHPELTTFYTNYTCSIKVLALGEPEVFFSHVVIECGRAVLGFSVFALSLPPMQFQPIIIWTVWHHLIYLKLLFFKTKLFVGILPTRLRNVTLYTCIYSPVSSVMTQEWRIWAMINSGSSKNAIFQCWL